MHATTTKLMNTNGDLPGSVDTTCSKDNTAVTMKMAPMSYISHGGGGGVGGVAAKDKDVNLHLLRNGVLLNRLDLLVHMNRSGWAHRKTFREEIRSLEFWRAVIAECLASFFYIFFTCGCYALEAETPSAFHLALASGSAMATLILCFGPISGGHVNPAVTVALTVTRKITWLRMVFYVTAQCGGAIAGTALLYGITVSGSNGNLGNPSVTLKQLSPLQGFGVEFVLTFIIVMTVFATLDPYQSPIFNYPSPLVGIAYLSCSLTGMGSTGAALNPARALGPAFVMNKWTNHWIYWGGPLVGAVLAGLIFEYVFDSRRNLKSLHDLMEDLNQESSLQSNEEDCDHAENTNHLSSPPPHTSQNNVYHFHPRYDEYNCRQRGLLTAPHANSGHHQQQQPPTHSNYAQFQPPPPPPPPLPLPNDYRAIHNAAYSESTSGNADSIYESASAFRPHSSASRNYSSIYGTRSGVKPPQRLECGGPGSTKF